MLSSTFRDLEQKRSQVLSLMGRYGFHEVAMENDAALPRRDKIDSSFHKVDQAEGYICIIGYRYGTREACAERNSGNLSITELEWRRARERNIPRCTLIMSPKYTGIPLEDLESITAEDRQRLAAFRKLAESDTVYASFENDTDFQIKAMQSLEQLRRDIDAADAAKEETQTPQHQPAAAIAAPADPDLLLPTTAPAFHFVRKPYVEKQGFEGRINELAQIDSWAMSKDGMLLYQAIGGMGKSMLTWHWAKNRSALVRNDWAGQLWYSFYEQGTDLKDFCVHALAYTRNLPPKTFRGLHTIDLAAALRRDLDAKPWLLILDGLERVLVAYNRAGKEYMTDEEAIVVRDDLGLDREPRSCSRPEDDEAMAMLAQAERGKLLVSSRLMPTALITAEQPIPGVSRIALEGLASADAEKVLRNAGVRGDGWRMQRFLDENFACHPLTVGVVAGQVMTLPAARSDFDLWVDHPSGGAEPALLVKDLRGRQNHILARAFDGLEEDEKNLLGAIALANIDLSMDIIRIINPKRPIEPQKVPEPEKLLTADDVYSKIDDPEIWVAYSEWLQDAGDDSNFADFAERNWAERKAKYEAQFAVRQDWEQKASVADDWLLNILPKLQARGLLQFDAYSEALDMHPVIRHVAMNSLSPQARSSTGSHVSDSLSSRPRKPFDDARTLDDLALAITRVQALNAAERFEAAWGLLIPELGDSLLRIEREDVLAELLHPFFPGGWGQPARKVTSEKAKAVDPLRWAARIPSNNQIHRSALEKVLRFDIASDFPWTVCRDLCELARLQESFAHKFRLLTLAKRMSDTLDNGDSRHECLLILADYDLQRGNLNDSQSHLDACRENFNARKMKASTRSLFVRVEVELARRSGGITKELIETSLKLVRSLGQVTSERLILEQAAGWHRDRGAHEEALSAFNDLIALANTTSARGLVPVYQARRAVSLLALDRTEEAWPMVLQFEKYAKVPNVISAAHYLALGDHQKARDHALGAYKSLWGDGPRFQNHWALEDCRKVLRALNEPEPQLPLFDPSKIQPFDFEADVERLIEKQIREKEEKKKKDAANPQDES